jgi:predicted nucleotidyltransferase
MTDAQMSSLVLADYEAKRDALLARIADVLTADPRVTAVWLSGSFGRNVADAWSDLDLYIAVDDDAFAAFLDERDQFYRRIGDPLLIQREMPSNAHGRSRFQLVIYPGPLEVDWNIGPASDATRPLETTIVFAHRPVPLVIPPSLSTIERQEQANDSLIFFWAMAPIAIKYVGRGESRRASSQIDLLTGAFIHLWRLVEMPDGPNPAAEAQNRGTEPELDAMLPRLGWEIDPLRALHVIRALCAEAERLHPALEAMGVAIPTEMPEQTAAMADLAASVLRQDTDRRRTYR